MENKSQTLKILNIPRSNFYYKSLKDEPDGELKIKIEKVLEIHKSYGHRRIALELKMNKKKIKRVMRKYNLHPTRGRKKPVFKRVKDDAAGSDNLLVSLFPLFKNHVWVTDFTYLKWHGRFVYLCTVIDLYTREVIGVAIKTNHSALLVSEALLNAVAAQGAASIIHSDQGSEYRSKLFRSVLAETKILQ